MIRDCRLLTYSVDGGAPRAGLLIDGRVRDLDALLGEGGRGDGAAADWMTVLQDWERFEPRIEAALASAPGTTLALDSLRLHAPLLYPGALYCAGANYSDHLLEMTGREPDPPEGRDPYIFLKPPRATIIGPDEPILLPRGSAQIDWEAEIALVIGRVAIDVPVARAMEHVLGFTIVHDVSARDRADRGGDAPPFRWDWMGSKGFATAAPMGPWITPLAAIADPGDMALRLTVNGEIKQDSNSRRLVHGFPELVAYLARATVLYPGDVIATGTPAGVGLPKGVFLKDGDHVVIEVDGLGRLENPVRAA